MNKKVLRVFFLVALTCGAALHAETLLAASAKPQVVTHETLKAQGTAAAQLSADELAFAARLTDQNRKLFLEKFTGEQRSSIRIAVDNGAQPDDAVHLLNAALQMKGNQAVVVNEEFDLNDLK